MGTLLCKWPYTTHTYTRTYSVSRHHQLAWVHISGIQRQEDVTIVPFLWYLGNSSIYKCMAYSTISMSKLCPISYVALPTSGSHDQKRHEQQHWYQVTSTWAMLHVRELMYQVPADGCLVSWYSTGIRLAAIWELILPLLWLTERANILHISGASRQMSGSLIQHQHGGFVFRC